VLCYRAWIETRWRFVICLAAMLLPSALLFHELGLVSLNGTPLWVSDPSFAYGELFGTHLPAVGIWMCASIFLGLGGLLRERALGTSTLTLTLPVSRAHVIATRVAVGVSETIVLALAPWLVNLSIAWFKRSPFSVEQAGWCVLLLVGGGTVYFAGAVLMASVVEGEYTAAALTFGLMFGAGYLAENVNGFRALDLYPLMSGAAFIDRKTSLFPGPMPWLGLFGSLSVAALMLLAAVGSTRRRDF
jgi:ABC-type transport system involved in multi-copper enzyme maturation permease subunit